MNDSERNQIAATYARDRLSPTPEQRSRITRRYEELSGFLHGSCFMSGSYARFTAVRPPKDLDVIWVSSDARLTGDSREVLEELASDLEETYRQQSVERVRIEVNDHSITVSFLDDPDGFSLDVVPAVELADKNGYGDPLYCVPSVQKLSHRERRRFKGPSNWIRSDPRGYISDATRLEESTAGRFRKVAKVAKGWRQKNKNELGDRFKLKSFHLEQIVFQYLKANPESTILGALLAVFGSLHEAIQRPLIRDRADSSVFIDQYVEELTIEEKGRIMDLQGEGYDLLSRVASATTESRIQDLLDQLTQPGKTPAFVAPTILVKDPPQKYGSR